MNRDNSNHRSVVRKFLWAMMLTVSAVLSSASNSRAQSNEVQQLLLNVEKLSQLKNILEDMKKGYVILNNGYNSVKNIAQGNFSLHEVFLDGLMMVSPEVRKYHKVAWVIKLQADILSEHKSAYRRFSSAGVFSVSDLQYLGSVYGRLSSESLQDLERLLMVITAGELRMSDDERLSAIDRIYESSVDKLGFLRSFNQKTGLLGLQRQRDLANIKALSGFFNQP